MSRQTAMFLGLLCYAILMALPLLEPVRLPTYKTKRAEAGCDVFVQKAGYTTSYNKSTRCD